MIKFRCDSCYRNTEWQSPIVNSPPELPENWLSYIERTGLVLHFCSEQCWDLKLTDIESDRREISPLGV